MGTTPIYGFPYPDPSDLVANYPALGQQLAEDIEDVLPTLGGLSPATPTTIANSGGTATLSGNTVTVSACNSVSLNGIFSAVYDNYRILINLTSPSTPALQHRLRSAGTDSSAATYNYQRAQADGTTATLSRFVSQTLWGNWTFNANFPLQEIWELSNPFASAYTVGQYQWTRSVSANDINIETGGVTFANTTSFDGFTIFPASSTITGTIAAYGYRK
jgi:hypothetical protein